MGALSLNIMMRLDDIFRPHTRRQQDKAYERQNKSKDTAMNGQLRFVHYTTARAALSIIKSKRMWMRNATCMSDYREVSVWL